MTTARKTKTVEEFGNFQTPLFLARSVTKLLKSLGFKPRSILEPICGKGAFLVAAIETFPHASLIGVERNNSYVSAAKRNWNIEQSDRVEVICSDFFTSDWNSIFVKNEGPWLVLGNPPWVTSSSLSSLKSGNLPEKSNFQGRAGIEAVTGKSNFDISEWMLLRYLDWLRGGGTVAVLCKTAVARKVLPYAWKERIVRSSRIYGIDAKAHFGATIDACLFVMELAPDSPVTNCPVFATLESKESHTSIGLCNGHLVSGQGDVARMEALWGPDEHYTWRSRVKHDCARVMELAPSNGAYLNGVGGVGDARERISLSSAQGVGHWQCPNKTPRDDAGDPTVRRSRDC